MKTQRDDYARLLQKERRERKGEIMSSKGVAIELMRAGNSGRERDK